MPPVSFHPAVAAWFKAHFVEATEPQQRAWPLIQAGQNVLIAAPTGSGKTLAAFLAAIDALVRQGIEAPLPDETFVVYVSPLKALSNDIQKNLAAPLAGIRAELLDAGLSRRSTSARWCAPATPRKRSGRACAAVRRTSSSPRPSRCTCCSAPNPGDGCSRPRAP